MDDLHTKTPEISRNNHDMVIPPLTTQYKFWIYKESRYLKSMRKRYVIFDIDTLNNSIIRTYKSPQCSQNGNHHTEEIYLTNYINFNQDATTKQKHISGKKVLSLVPKDACKHKSFLFASIYRDTLYSREDCDSETGYNKLICALKIYFSYSKVQISIENKKWGNAKVQIFEVGKNLNFLTVGKYLETRTAKSFNNYKKWIDFALTLPYTKDNGYFIHFKLYVDITLKMRGCYGYDYPELEDRYKQILEWEPTHANTIAFYARLLFCRKDYITAEKYLKKSIELDAGFYKPVTIGYPQDHYRDMSEGGCPFIRQNCLCECLRMQNKLAEADELMNDFIASGHYNCHVNDKGKKESQSLINKIKNDKWSLTQKQSNVPVSAVVSLDKLDVPQRVFEAWLHCCNLGKYLNVFRKKEQDDIRMIKYMDETVLEEVLNGSKYDNMLHKRLLMGEIELMKNKMILFENWLKSINMFDKHYMAFFNAGIVAEEIMENFVFKEIDIKNIIPCIKNDVDRKYIFEAFMNKVRNNNRNEYVEGREEKNNATEYI